GADLHTVFGGEAAQVVELCLLHLDEEVVALVASPREVGLGRPYALQKSCGECVHAAPPRPGSWVGGTGVCHWEGAITSPAGAQRCPSRAATVPDTHARSAEADRGVPLGVRHMQSVIAGCKAVLPPLPSTETSTGGENLAFPRRRPGLCGRAPV